MRYVAERTALGEHNEALLAVTIKEEKGSFKSFCKALNGRSITEFNYRYTGPGDAEIFVGVGLRNGETELASLKQELSDKGYSYVDMTNNELAKLHVRYMVGGKPGEQLSERLFRFEFPEYPERSSVFLILWVQTGISAYSTIVIMVLQPVMFLLHLKCLSKITLAFSEHLQRLAYAYQEETNNPCYQQFLSSKAHNLAQVANS